MSYEYSFWKQNAAMDEAVVVYDMLRKDCGVIDTLDVLPLDEIFESMNDALVEYEIELGVGDRDMLIEVDKGSIEIIAGRMRQDLSFYFRGWIKEKVKSKIVGVMAAYGCPLFDPQIKRRFDWVDGLELGELPEFDLDGEKNSEALILMSDEVDEGIKIIADVMGTLVGEEKKQAIYVETMRRYENGLKEKKERKRKNEEAWLDKTQRWRRLGIDVKWLDIAKQNYEHYEERHGVYDKNFDQQFCRESDVQLTASISIYHHLELLTCGEGMHYGERAVACVIEYLFGGWRDEHVGFLNDFDDEMRKWSRTDCRVELDWSETYRLGLMFAYVLGDDDAIGKLLEWPGEDLPFDEGNYAAKKAEYYFNILFAKCELGEGQEESMRRLESLLVNSRSARGKMLWNCYRAICEGDQKGFEKWLKNIAQFQRSRALDYSCLNAVMTEGTVLWHLAKRKGLDVDVFEENVMERLVRVETLKDKI
ncbi:hypothetical protein JD969_06150 [Planctomycetota bacterium]|nr:hypothetical protein JD969_06150 [Planctomycetota bacterium]